MHPILFALTCLALPVIWGVIVHRVFDLIEKKLSRGTERSESKFPDYQI
ncbi:hypothetical protein KOR42_31070 [Thalassoglobus neptunius]|uniref:Uncharacterized protein n=1 Tax=Thalassoglobus neptunius TaxID=1938619 RepID=A0A5C5WQ31_9PLAN|nr:hypothetical protein [Thalassoglobus neptunius]TWT52239.1 hypothetical protein KOR42_31070 [Thalassoglobus neptunius]